MCQSAAFVNTFTVFRKSYISIKLDIAGGSELRRLFSNKILIGLSLKVRLKFQRCQRKIVSGIVFLFLQLDLLGRFTSAEF